MLTALRSPPSAGSTRLPTMVPPFWLNTVANGGPRVSGDRPRSGWKLLAKSRSTPRRHLFSLTLNAPHPFQRSLSRSPQPARKRVVSAKCVSVRVVLGGRRHTTKKHTTPSSYYH